MTEPMVPEDLNSRIVNPTEWRRKYFEIERAHSHAVDKIGELTSRLLLRERELAERGSDKAVAEAKLAKAESALAALREENKQLRLPKATTCSYCASPVPYSSVYRCYDCDGTFHKDCLRRHIGHSDPRQYLCAKRVADERDSLKAQLERMREPVTDEELTPHCLGKKYMLTEVFNRVLSRRAEGKEEA